MRTKKYIVFVGGLLLVGFMMLNSVNKVFAENQNQNQNENEGRNASSSINSLDNISQLMTEGENESKLASTSEQEQEQERERERKSVSETDGAQIEVSASGETQLKGAKLVSISGTSISITVFGLPITVTTASSTRFVGAADTSGLIVGDTLSIKGIISQTTGVVTASVVQDESQRQNMLNGIQQQIQALLEQVRQLREKIKTSN